jgi:putative transposase
LIPETLATKAFGALRGNFCQSIRAQGLYLFFLPAYCSEMNPIEVEWGHLKRDELVGQMFESEVEMAYHVVAGLESRGERMGHTTEYVEVKDVKPA